MCNEKGERERGGEGKKKVFVVALARLAIEDAD